MAGSTVVSLVASGLGILGILGGAVAFLAAMRQRTTIETLEKNNDALDARVHIVEEAEARCQVELAQMRSKVEVLTGTVTQAQAVAELLAKVSRIEEVAQALDNKVERHFAQVLEKLAS